MAPTRDQLTRREIAVLRLTAQGLPVKMVAFRLGLTSRTIHFHYANIKAKLGVKTRAEVMFSAGRDGLLGEYIPGGEDVDAAG